MAEPYVVTHSEWNEDPYGWQVRRAGWGVVDIYAERALAEAYAAYMNERVEQANRRLSPTFRKDSRTTSHPQPKET